MSITDGDPLIGRPYQCESCYQWLIPGQQGHICELPRIDFTATWRQAIAESQRGITAAYEHRERIMRAAVDAGLSLRDIGEAADMSAAGVQKIVGKRKPTTLDTPIFPTAPASARKEQ